MRTTHLRSRGKSLLKRATKLKPNFARNSSVHLMTLMMILLHARDNAHSKLVVPANQAKIEQVATIDDQDVDQIQTEALIRDKVVIPMDDPGTVRAHTATLTKIPLTPPENHLTRLEAFMNVLTPTTNLMRGIINSIECPDDQERKPKHA